MFSSFEFFSRLVEIYPAEFFAVNDHTAKIRNSSVVLSTSDEMCSITSHFPKKLGAVNASRYVHVNKFTVCERKSRVNYYPVTQPLVFLNTTMYKYFKYNHWSFATILNSGFILRQICLQKKLCLGDGY